MTSSANALAWLLALGLAGLTSGCIERYMVIESQPAGARVTIDGKYVGTTPIAKLPYTHTGRRRFMLEKKGYQRHISIEPITGPWYCQFPLDIISYLLLPYTFTIEHSLAAFPLTDTLPLGKR